MNREDFVMLDQDIVYFDNGATTLKPKRVVDSLVNYYTKHTSNIHRGDYDAAVVTSDLYDSTREVVKNFINCNDSNEVVFTSGTTMSINMIVFGFMKRCFGLAKSRIKSELLRSGRNPAPFLYVQELFSRKKIP